MTQAKGPIVLLGHFLTASQCCSTRGKLSLPFDTKEWGSTIKNTWFFQIPAELLEGAAIRIFFPLCTPAVGPSISLLFYSLSGAAVHCWLSNLYFISRGSSSWEMKGWVATNAAQGFSPFLNPAAMLAWPETVTMWWQLDRLWKTSYFLAFFFSCITTPLLTPSCSAAASTFHPAWVNLST